MWPRRCSCLATRCRRTSRTSWPSSAPVPGPRSSARPSATRRFAAPPPPERGRRKRWTCSARRLRGRRTRLPTVPCRLFDRLFTVTIGRVDDALFVGRDHQVGVLHDLLAEVKAGVGGVVLVVGEQGVGKSSLLRAGLRGAEGQGCSNDDFPTPCSPKIGRAHV